MNDDRETRKMLEEVEDKIEKKQLKFKLIGKVLKVAGVIYFFPTLFSFFLNKIGIPPCPEDKEGAEWNTVVASASSVAGIIIPCILPSHG